MHGLLHAPYMILLYRRPGDAEPVGTLIPTGPDGDVEYTFVANPRLKKGPACTTY